MMRHDSPRWALRDQPRQGPCGTSTDDSPLPIAGLGVITWEGETVVVGVRFAHPSVQLPHSASSARGIGMNPAHTVLIVDDDPLLRRVLKVWLNQRGYPALEAKDIATALRLSREHSIWVTLTDLNLVHGD